MKELKRLLMTADTVGGVWQYALELSEALGEHDVEIALATMGKPLTREQWDAVGRLTHVQVFESSFKLEWMDDPWEDLDKAGKWLCMIEQQIRPDLIHLNNFVHGALSWTAPVLVIGHSCVYSWFNGVRSAGQQGRRPCASSFWA